MVRTENFLAWNAAQVVSVVESQLIGFTTLAGSCAKTVVSNAKMYGFVWNHVTSNDVKAVAISFSMGVTSNVTQQYQVAINNQNLTITTPVTKIISQK